MVKKILTASLLLFFFSCLPCFPGVVSAGSKGVKELAEILAKQLNFPVNTISDDLARIVSKCGDEALDVIDKHGVAAFRVVKSAGDDAPYVVKAIRNYGDEAIRVAQTPAGRSVLREGKSATIRAVAKHGDDVIPLIRHYGDDCAKAFAELSPANGRRFIQLVDEGVLPAGHVEQLMPVMSKGDAAMDFIWRHRKLLASAAALTVFLSNPEPYISGMKDLVKDVVVEPITETTTTIINKVNWNLWIGVIIMLTGLWFLFKQRGQLRKNKSGEASSS